MDMGKKRMKRKLWGLLLAFAVLLTSVNIPAMEAGATETYSGTAIVQADPDDTIKNMYNVPVTYYDYLDDNELISGWREVKPYGNDNSGGWAVFGNLNSALANYYKTRGLTTTGIYFGNLLSTDKAKGDRANEVAKQIEAIQGIYNNYWYNANNSNYFVSANGEDAYRHSAQGLVYNTLTEDGDLQIAAGIEAPWFSEDFLSRVGSGNNYSYGKMFSSRFPFRADTGSDGVTYYEFDSNAARDNVKYNENSNTFSYGAGEANGVKDCKEVDWDLPVGNDENKGYGFFPFNYKGENGSNNDWLDYGFGAEIEIRFNLPKGGKIGDSPVTFEFTGDDDVWIFIDGKLVLDLGGGHKKANGKIDFSTLTAEVTTGTETINSGTEMNAVSLQEALQVNSSDELRPNQAHTMKIFYMERGMIESNLKIRFNMQPLEHEFIAEKTVDTSGVNDGLKSAVADADEFRVTLSTDGSPAADKTYQKNHGVSEGTEYGLKTGSDGSFTLKDGDQAVFKRQFDDQMGKTFTALETTVEDGKSYLSYDTRWEAVDLENNNAEIQSGTGANAAFTYNKLLGDEFTPVRNKLTYINTPKTGTLTVEKSAVDKDGNVYTDPDTEFEFEILMDLGLRGEGHFETPDVIDEDAIYFRNTENWSQVYAYCYNSETDRKDTWPGTLMTELAAAEGVYKLDGIKGNYRYVIFTDNSGKQYPAQNAEWQTIGDNNYFYVNSGSLQCGTYTEKGEEVWVPGEAAGYAGYNLTYTVNNESRTAVSGIFTLKAGEKAVFTGIPLGTKFKIKETSSEGYSLKGVEINNTEIQPGQDHYYYGELSSNTNSFDVKVTNQKADVSVNLSAWKTIDGSAENIPRDQFTFLLKGRSDVAGAVDTSGVSMTVKNTNNGKVTFPTLTYTEEGSYYYTISEQIPEGSNNYIYDRSEYEVKVVVTADGDHMSAATTVTKVKDKDGVPISPPQNVENIAKGITFDNKENLASLTIQKWIVTEAGDKLAKNLWSAGDNSFLFRLEKRNDTGEWEACTSQEYSVSGGTASVTGKTDSYGRFRVTAQEMDTVVRVEFKGLVIGEAYRVVEELKDRPGYLPYSVTVDGNERMNAQPEAGGNGEYQTGEIVIKKGGNQVVYKNYPLSSITIKKENEEGEPLAGARFILEKLGEDSDAESVKIGEEETTESGEVRFLNLHAGTYRIREIKTASGYILLKEPIIIELPFRYTKGSIVNGVTAESDGITYKITLTVRNGQAFDLPASGLKGIGPIIFAGAAVIAAAGTALAVKNRRARRRVPHRRRRRPH